MHCLSPCPSSPAPAGTGHPAPGQLPLWARQVDPGSPGARRTRRRPHPCAHRRPASERSHSPPRPAPSPGRDRPRTAGAKPGCCTNTYAKYVFSSIPAFYGDVRVSRLGIILRNAAQRRKPGLIGGQVRYLQSSRVLCRAFEIDAATSRDRAEVAHRWPVHLHHQRYGHWLHTQGPVMQPGHLAGSTAN